MSSEQRAEFRQFGNRVSKDSSFASLVANDAREAHEISSRLSATTARSERAEVSLSERTAVADRISSAYERGESISIDLAQDPHNLQMFMRYAEQYGGTSASAHVLMASELARQSLRPSVNRPDGTALPTSFDQVREESIRARARTATGSEVDARRTANDSQVSKVRDRIPTGSGPSMPASGRSAVEAKGANIRAQARARDEAFDSKAEIARDTDGTVSSNRSLLMSAGKQVAKDAAASLDNVRAAAKDLLRKR